MKSFKSHSYFLFGNRGVGKSTLLNHLFPRSQHLWIDLLDYETEKRLALRPQLLKEMLDSTQKQYPEKTFVIIDEIQKNPSLLDTVHSQIEKKHFHFILTGSSSRKLKRQGTNLLAGRAFVTHLFPFTHMELGDQFHLDSVLQWGSLPKIFELEDEDRVQYLNAYSDTYLREEIIAEQIVRNITPFRQFLEVAAQSQAKIINYSKISQTLGVDVTTVQNYFQILEDTFTGLLLQPYDESIRKRQRKNPKFYFFDTGITRTLQNRVSLPIQNGTFEYGGLFEQFIILEFARLNSYFKKLWKFSYLQTQTGVEVNLIVERPGKDKLFIEIKSTAQVQSLNLEKLNGFKSLVKDANETKGLILSQDPISRIEDNIYIMNWKEAFQKLFIEDSIG